MINFRHTVIILFLAIGVAGAPAYGQTPREVTNASPLVADLSEDLIAITTGFTGTEVLLFGATEGAGEIIVVVRAPESRVVVRRKERVGGIWINADRLTFDKVPGFYHVAASQPLADLLPEAVLEREQIGAERLSLPSLISGTEDEIAAFSSALIRNKQKVGLFSVELGEIKFLGNRLFRTQVQFPSSVPTGVYTATVYLVDGGEIVDRTETPLQVRKTGFEANVFEFANQQSAIYGIIAILIALAAGWFAGIVFRNV